MRATTTTTTIPITTRLPITLTYGGRYCETNRYGADLIRQAVNYGTRKACAPVAPTARTTGATTIATATLQDANYGYNGYYIDQDQYNYYFRQGFQRGYDDGYSSDYRNGSRDNNGNYTILAAVLAAVVRIQYYVDDATSSTTTVNQKNARHVRAFFCLRHKEYWPE